MLEIHRWIIHISFGVLVIIALTVLGSGRFEYVEGALLATFVVGLWIVDQKLKKRNLPVVDYILEMLERPHAMPAYGAFWYGMGILLLLSFIRNMNYALAGIAVLALGDGASTLVGMGGNTRLFYNKKKTLEGTAAFFVFSSLASYIFLGPTGIALSFFCSVAESIDWGVDDNFIIPLTCLLFYLIFV